MGLVTRGSHGSMVRGAAPHRRPNRSAEAPCGLVQYRPSTNLLPSPVSADADLRRGPPLSFRSAATRPPTLIALRLPPLPHVTAEVFLRPPELPLYDPNGPREECGVVGLYAPGRPVARLTYVGLHALQHRGQESAGIAASDGTRLTLHKRLGLVSQVFDEETLAGFDRAPGGGERSGAHLAIGHTRYSTTGSNSLPNVQPVYARSELGELMLGHNGNLTNAT